MIFVRYSITAFLFWAGSFEKLPAQNHSGHSKTTEDAGAMESFHAPQQGDLVKFHLRIKTDTDSLIYNSESIRPMNELVINKIAYCLEATLMKLNIGDSLTFPCDAILFYAHYFNTGLPECLKKNATVIISLKLLDIVREGRLREYLMGKYETETLMAEQIKQAEQRTIGEFMDRNPGFEFRSPVYTRIIARDSSKAENPPSQIFFRLFDLNLKDLGGNCGNEFKITYQKGKLLPLPALDYVQELIKSGTEAQVIIPFHLLGNYPTTQVIPDREPALLHIRVE